MSNGNENTNLTVPIIVGIALVLLAGWLVAATQVGGPESSEGAVSLSASEAPATSEDGATGSTQAAVDLDAAIAAAQKGGCAACHVIPGIPNAQGQVGPDLSNIGAAAATRIDGYSAEQYIHESLAAPSAFTAPDCPTGPCITGAMPQLQLTDEEIDALVNYLVTLGG